MHSLKHESFNNDDTKREKGVHSRENEGDPSPDTKETQIFHVGHGME